MSDHRRDTGDAETPNRPEISQDSELVRSQFEAPANPENINVPAFTSTDTAQSDSPWGISTEFVPEDDLYDLDLTRTREMFDYPSPSSYPAQSESLGLTTAGGVASLEEDLPVLQNLTSRDFDERDDPSSTNLAVGDTSMASDIAQTESSGPATTEGLSSFEEDSLPVLLSLVPIDFDEQTDPSSANLPVGDTSMTSDIAQTESSGPTTTEGMGSFEQDSLPVLLSLAPIDFDEQTDPSSENLPVCSGSSSSGLVEIGSSGQTSQGVSSIDLDQPSSSRAGTSMDPGVAGPSGSGNVPSQRHWLDQPGRSQDGPLMEPNAAGPSGACNVPMQRELVPPETGQNQIKIVLLHKRQWQRLARRTNLMTIRGGGCQMKPDIRFRISGLKPTTRYSLFLRFRRRDPFQWGFVNSTWRRTAIVPEPEHDPIVEHHRSPKPGNFWMNITIGIAFTNLKLSCRSVPDQANKVCLHVFHAYQPEIIVRETAGPGQPENEPVATAAFKETNFIAVTTFKDTTLKVMKELFPKAR